MTLHTPSQSANAPSPPSNPWQRRRPDGADGETPILFWLAVLGLGCVTFFTAALGASAWLGQKAPERLLRLGLWFPKLNHNHGDRKASAFRMSEPEVSELAHSKDRKSPESPMPPVVIAPPQGALIVPRHFGEEPPRVAPPLGLLPIAPVELAPTVETCRDPVVFLHACAPHQGDSPMIRNWKTITMYSLLTVAAIIMPPPAMILAQDAKGDDLQKSIQKLIERIDKLEKKTPTLDQDELAKIIRDELKSSLGELNKKVTAIQADHTWYKLHIEKQKEDLNKLALEVESLRRKSTEGTPSVDKAFLEEMRNAFKAINETLAKIGPTKVQTSMSPPINGAAKGRIMLVNLYNENLLFLINGKDYVIPAGKSRLVEDLPAGPLHYRVHWKNGILVDQSTSIAGGETFTLTAATQR